MQTNVWPTMRVSSSEYNIIIQFTNQLIFKSISGSIIKCGGIQLMTDNFRNTQYSLTIDCIWEHKDHSDSPSKGLTSGQKFRPTSCDLALASGYSSLQQVCLLFIKQKMLIFVQIIKTVLMETTKSVCLITFAINLCSVPF